MTILLPRFFTARNVQSALEAALAISANESARVQIDASQLAFIDPFGLSLLASACERVGLDGRLVY